MLESISHKAMVFEDNVYQAKDQELILEEPLSMRIDGNPYAVVMRTPGDEIYHAAGFFLSEGLVNHRDNFTHHETHRSHRWTQINADESIGVDLCKSVSICG